MHSNSEVIEITMPPILNILRKMRLSKGEEPTQDLRAGKAFRP